MRALPAEEKAKIEQLTEGLKLEKTKLERELTKWDESGNDIIILAKKMCMMMMEMSDFTRYKSYCFCLLEIDRQVRKTLPKSCLPKEVSRLQAI